MKILDRVSLYYSSSWRWEDKYSAAIDDRGGVSTRTTLLSFQKVDFGIDRNDGVFCLSQSHLTESHVEVSLSRDDTVGDFGGSSFSVDER